MEIDSCYHIWKMSGISKSTNFPDIFQTGFLNPDYFQTFQTFSADVATLGTLGNLGPLGGLKAVSGPCKIVLKIKINLFLMCNTRKGYKKHPSSV